MPNNIDNKYFSLKFFLLLATFIQVIRVSVLYFLLKKYDLYVDEVYYWGWSHHLDFGYYSKPPVIAWLIKIVTMFFGESEISLKIGSAILYPITASIIYLIGDRLFSSKKIAFFSALVFLTLPAVSLSSMIISTDVVLLLFWSLCLYFFIRAIDDDKLIDWIVVGVVAGLGMLSKYNMIFFLISVVLVLLFNKEYRKIFKNKKLYLALLISIVLFLPNLYWQYSHDFVSFVHTGEISQINKTLFHPKKFLEFFGAQFGVFGPLFFAFLLYLIYKSKIYFKDNSMRILYLFVLPYFIFITTLSLLTRAFANWSAPIYIAATLLVVAYMVRNKKIKLLKYSIGINIFLALVVYMYYPITSMLDIELNSKNDPYKRIAGWSILASKVDEVYRAKGLRLLFNDRTTMAELIYYIKPHPFDSLMYNPRGTNHNQYELKYSLENRHKGKSFLFVIKKDSLDKNRMKKYFKNIELVKKIELAIYKDYTLGYEIYKVEDFRGYR